MQRIVCMGCLLRMSDWRGIPMATCSLVQALVAVHTFVTWLVVHQCLSDWRWSQVSSTCFEGSLSGFVYVWLTLDSIGFVKLSLEPSLQYIHHGVTWQFNVHSHGWCVSVFACEDFKTALISVWRLRAQADWPRKMWGIGDDGSVCVATMGCGWWRKLGTVFVNSQVSWHTPFRLHAWLPNVIASMTRTKTDLHYCDWRIYVFSSTVLHGVCCTLSE